MSWWAANIRAPQWLTMDAAVEHCTRGIGIWPWASSDQGSRARRGDGVRAGDVLTLETLSPPFPFFASTCPT